MAPKANRNDDDTVAYRVVIPRKTWEKFKDTVPRTVPTLNMAIINLIENQIKENDKVKPPT